MSDFALILATTDLSTDSLPGVKEAAGLARRLGSEIVLLTVVEDDLPPILGTTSESERGEILEGYRLRAADEAEAFAREHLAGCRVRTEAVVGVAPREIVAYAEQHGVDLIVTSSHGYGPFRQLLLGSTAERVLHRAPCPVLVVPSRKE